MTARRWLARVGRVALALACALVLVEVALRAMGMRPPGRGHSSGGVLMRNVPEAEAPGVGWALVPGAEHEFTYPAADGGTPRVVHERINADGWRDRRYPKEKASGVVRVCALGDSVTYGTGVEEDETYPKYLERICDERIGRGKVEVMNCGVFNTNTEQQVGLLRWRVMEWKPDVVFLCSTVADASGYGVPAGPAKEKEVDWESAWSARLGLTSGVWDDADMEKANDAQRRCMWWRRRSVLVDVVANRTFALLMGRAQERNYLAGWEVGSPGRAEVEQALDRAVVLAGKGGFELWATMFPFFSKLDEGHPFVPIHRAYEEMCRERGVVTVDLLTPYLGLDAAKLRAHAHDRHPNAAAHRIAAEELFEVFGDELRARVEREEKVRGGG